jgi:hypothetical protein
MRKSLISAALSITSLVLLGQSAIAAPDISGYPKIPTLNDGQQFSPGMAIAATSGMKTSRPTIVTLESEWSWCAGRYFSPNIPVCFRSLEQKGQKIGTLVRTTWNLDCEKNTIQEKSRLIDNETIQYSLNGGTGKGTQRPWRVYAYACQSRN